MHFCGSKTRNCQQLATKTGLLQTSVADLMALLPLVEVPRGQQLKDVVTHLIIADHEALVASSNGCIHPVPVGRREGLSL